MHSVFIFGNVFVELGSNDLREVNSSEDSVLMAQTEPPVNM